MKLLLRPSPTSAKPALPSVAWATARFPARAPNALLNKYFSKHCVISPMLLSRFRNCVACATRISLPHSFVSGLLLTIESDPSFLRPRGGSSRPRHPFRSETAKSLSPHAYKSNPPPIPSARPTPGFQRARSVDCFRIGRSRGDFPILGAGAAPVRASLPAGFGEQFLVSRHW